MCMLSSEAAKHKEACDQMFIVGASYSSNQIKLQWKPILNRRRILEGRIKIILIFFGAQPNCWDREWIEGFPLVAKTHTFFICTNLHWDEFCYRSWAAILKIINYHIFAIIWRFTVVELPNQLRDQDQALFLKGWVHRFRTDHNCQFHSAIRC